MPKTAIRFDESSAWTPTAIWARQASDRRTESPSACARRTLSTARPVLFFSSPSVRRISSAGVEAVPIEIEDGTLEVGEASEAQRLDGANHGGVGRACVAAQRCRRARENNLAIFADELQHAMSGCAEPFVRPTQESVEIVTDLQRRRTH